MSNAEHMEQPLTLVDPDERLALAVGSSTLYYRRLGLGALAALERQQTILAGDPGGGPPRAVLPAAALEAAICAHVLKGWRGVLGADGREVRFRPGSAGLLPAMARRLLTGAAYGLAGPVVNEPGGEQ